MNRNLYAGATTLLALIPLSTLTETTNGSAVNLVGYDGNVAILFAADDPSGTDTPTLTFTLEESATGSGSWTAVSGVEQEFTAAGEAKVVVQSDKLKQFVRAVATISGTDPSFACAAYVIAIPR